MQTPNEVAKMFAREYGSESMRGSRATLVWHAVRAAIEYDRRARARDSQEG